MHLKVLSLKQTLQRLPIALAQVKVGSTYENLLNEIPRVIYCLYGAKEITKKVYTYIYNIYIYVYINSKNRRTYDYHRLLLDLADKINLKRSNACIALSNPLMCYSCKNNEFEISALTWNEKFDLTDGSHSVSF